MHVVEERSYLSCGFLHGVLFFPFLLEKPRREKPDENERPRRRPPTVPREHTTKEGGRIYMYTRARKYSCQSSYICQQTFHATVDLIFDPLKNAPGGTMIIVAHTQLYGISEQHGIPKMIDEGNNTSNSCKL